MRRTLTLAAAVIVLLGLFAGAYFYFFSGTPAVEVAGPPGGLPGAGNLPPSGSTLGEGEPVSGESPTTPAAAVSPRLVKISAGPIVPGEVVVDLPPVSEDASPESVVYFIERKSGNVYTYQVQRRTLTRVNNRTVPGIQSAVWLQSATTTFIRYLSGADFGTVNTYGLSVHGTSGFFLPQNLSGLAAGNAGILMLASGVNGSTASLARPDGSRASTVFSTPLTSLRVAFAGNGYLATTKASARLPGASFLVDSSGRFTRIAGPNNGLTALPSPSGAWVLVSYTEGSAMQLTLVNTATNESLPLPIATITDKCVWANDSLVVYCGVPQNPPGAAYPDDWYQGAVRFSDRLWKIQVSGRYAQLVLDFPKEAGETLDATALALNPKGTVLVFVNKNDGALWSYSL